MKTFPALCLATSLALIALHAQTPKPAEPAAGGDPFVKHPGAVPADAELGLSGNLVLVLEVYALPKDDALAILESEPGSTGRYQRVLDLAKTKKARLEILTALAGKSGQKSTTETYDEVRYAAEYQPGAAKGMLPAATSFETRNVGDSIEVEPVIGSDGWIELSLVPQRVSLAGFRELAGAPGDPTAAQPLFVTQKLTTSTSLEAGTPHYLGTLSRPGENGVADGAAAEIWLAFLRINLHGPAAGEVKSPAKPLNTSALNLEYSAYSLDRADAREILVSMPTLEAPWEKLQGLLREKHARFEHLVAFKCKSGQKSTAEENHEVRYATGYAPPGHTRIVETTERKIPAQPGGGNRNNPANRDSIETTTLSRDIPNAEGTPGAPLTIETRNAGVSVEVEPVVGPDGLTIELSHALRSVAHRGNLNTGRAPAFLDQPLFEARSITTNQTITLGRHLLVGTFNPPGANGVNERTDDGRTWLLFVRALPNEP